MLRPYLSALSFLTILPVLARFCDAAGFAGCARYFPLAGLTVGALAAAAGLAASALWPAPVAAVVCVGALAVLSGGLHLDGLSDTADGFASARDKEQILRIMKDSRIGAMGTLALLFVLAAKIASLSVLPPGAFWAALLLAPATGRVAILLLRLLTPPANPDGLGATAGGPAGWGCVLLWSGSLLAGGWALLGPQAAAATLAGLLGACGIGWIALRKIGGFTGDVLGAGCEIGEAVFLLTLAVHR